MRVMRIAKMYKKKCWKSSITHHCGDANQNQRGCHFTPIWMTTIKEIRDNKFQAVEETECCWGLVWMQIDAAIRETRVESPKETKKKKKLNLSHEPAIPLLWIYPTKYLPDLIIIYN